MPGGFKLELRSSQPSLVVARLRKSCAPQIQEPGQQGIVVIGHALTDWVTRCHELCACYSAGHKMERLAVFRALP